jgi:hypothetical protein
MLARLGQTEEAYFAFTHEIADGRGGILDRHGPLHPMLVEQIDVIDAEREERCVGDLTDVFGPTIGSEGRGPRKVYTKCRRDAIRCGTLHCKTCVRGSST